jgi:bifunctional non-homologous end joining protein LigD
MSIVPLTARCRMAGGQGFRRSLFSRALARGRARPLRRDHVEGEAQGPHLHRLAAQPARQHRDDALYRPRSRSGAPVSAPVTWAELDGIEAANRWHVSDADELLDRAAAKALAGWGTARQTLPDL